MIHQYNSHHAPPNQCSASVDVFRWAKNALKCHFLLLFEATFLQHTCIVSHWSCHSQHAVGMTEEDAGRALIGRLSERESPSHAISGSSARGGGSVCKLSAGEISLFIKDCCAISQGLIDSQGKKWKRSCSIIEGVRDFSLSVQKGCTFMDVY